MMGWLARSVYTVPSVEVRLGDDIFVKVMTFHRAGDRANQHRHEFEHVSVVMGAFRVLIGNEIEIPVDAQHLDIGGEHEDSSVIIPPGIWHQFIARENGAKLMCIHNTHGKGQPSVIEEASVPTSGAG